MNSVKTKTVKVTIRLFYIVFICLYNLPLWHLLWHLWFLQGRLLLHICSQVGQLPSQHWNTWVWTSLQWKYMGVNILTMEITILSIGPCFLIDWTTTSVLKWLNILLHVHMHLKTSHNVKLTNVFYKYVKILQ